MVDLHLHTTASDGLCTPERLVEEAAVRGLTVLAVTDHDTTAAVDATSALAQRAGITSVPAIEITAMAAGHEIHVLGYFIDPSNAALGTFLADARAARQHRVRAIGDRLARFGAPIDVASLLAAAERNEGGVVGRPHVARALVAAGHARDVNDAFDRWLGRGRPAFIRRAGSSPAQVIAVIHDAGGVASLAHPGVAGIDADLPSLVDAGLDALEVYHPDHDDAARDRYLAVARRFGLLITGGSDYHGDPAHGASPGSVTLPAGDWERLSTWPRRSSR